MAMTLGPYGNIVTAQNQQHFQALLLRYLGRGWAVVANADQLTIGVFLEDPRQLDEFERDLREALTWPPEGTG